MFRPRIIPVLLMKNRGVYKGVKFKDHKYVGDPINTVRIFNYKEAYEITIFDIEASRFNKPIDFDYLKEVVSEAFMPVGYCGGIRTVEDAKKLFVIPVTLNLFAQKNPLILKLIENLNLSIDSSVD